jgi:crotonobetainyl-CoA:carnitine CoA-transferase CaiB-like acyl-CoA transferase
VRPCSDVRVLDLGQGYGAIPGMILADFGAEVIKVEPPGGEPFRQVPGFWQWNRGKRGLTVDLKTSDGRAVVAALARDADVIVENFRPGVLERLGLDFDQLAGENPGLIMLSITGFDGHARYGNVKGYDGVVAAVTGQLVIQNGYRDDGPIYDAIPKCSFGAAMLGLIGTFAALQARQSTGRGQRVTSSLIQGNFVYSYGGIKGETDEITSTLSQVQGRDPHNTMPGYRIAECSDGKWIQSGSAGGRIFDNLMRALDIEFYFNDPRYKNGPAKLSIADRDELIAAIDDTYRKRPLAEWVERLDDNDAAYGLFATTQEFMDHAQMRHNGHVIEVEDPDLGAMSQIGPLVTFKGREWLWPGPAPRLGAGDDVVPSWTTTDRPQPTPVPGSLAGPLDGVTVVDLANFAAAPGGPGLLADLGARVIKVEPIAGDPMVAGAVSASELFNRINRSKERMSIDLKHPLGQEVLHRLVGLADAVVHNYRPGVPERLGLDYETLRQHNEQLVYLYAASFGSTGPDSRRPAFDPVMSAMAGGEVLQAGRGNPPQQRQTTDHSALLGVALALLLGLRERERTGEGQELETSMLCSAAYLLSDDFIRHEGKAERPLPDSGQYGLGPRYRLYRTGGQGWVFLACPQQDEWERLCQSIGRQDWVDDPRFGAGDNLGFVAGDEAADLLSAVFSSQTAQEWEEQLLAVDVACVIADGTWVDFLFDEAAGLHDDFVTTYEMEPHGQVQQCGLGVNLSMTPGVLGPVDALGGSTRAILAELGYDDAAIEQLEAETVVRSDG